MEMISCGHQCVCREITNFTSCRSEVYLGDRLVTNTYRYLPQLLRQDILFLYHLLTVYSASSGIKSFDTGSDQEKIYAGRKVFRDFLRGEYSEENIMFWLACEELKRETDPDAVEEKARFIYEDYISILSPKEVSLDSRVREVVNRNMVEPTPHTFDDAQLQIYTLMHRDSYPRFVNSPLFKTLARLSSAESGPTAAAAGTATSPAPAAPAPP